jgi:hypothetical protein
MIGARCVLSPWASALSTTLMLLLLPPLLLQLHWVVVSACHAITVFTRQISFISSSCVCFLCSHYLLCLQHCMVAWLRKKAECPTCRASVWPAQANGILFHFHPIPASVAVAGVGGAGAAGAHDQAGNGAAAAPIQPHGRIEPPIPLPPAALAADFPQPHIISAVSAAEQLPRASATTSPANTAHLVAALDARPSASKDPDVESSGVRRASNQRMAVDAVAYAAAAPISADAVAASSTCDVARAFSSSSFPAATATVGNSQEWTTVARRRRRHVELQ